MNYEVSDGFHTRKGSNKGMRVEYLRYFSDFYNVSTDYLLGLTEIKSPDDVVRAACSETGLQDKNIAALMGFSYPTQPEQTKYLHEMVNEFISFAVGAISNYMAFRKYISLDNQRWSDMSQLTQDEYDGKMEEIQKLSAAAEEHGYLIMSYNQAAEKYHQKLCEKYGEYLLTQYRTFDNERNPEKRKETRNGND